MEISDALWQKLRRQRLAGTPLPPCARSLEYSLAAGGVSRQGFWLSWLPRRHRRPANRSASAVARLDCETLPGTRPRHLSITRQFCPEKSLMRGLGSKEESLAFWGARGLSSTDRID